MIVKSSIPNALTGFVAAILIWQVLVTLIELPDYIIPSPRATLDAFISNADQILSNGVITVQEIAIGFIVANTLSVLIAIMIGFFPRVESTAMTAAVILKTLPIIALAPILVLWFGPGIWSKVAAVIVICFFPSLVNILRGIKSLDGAARDLILLYSPTKIQTVRYFILPGVQPYLYSALKVSSSLAVVGALVGEFISANKGLGFMIISGYYSMDIPLVFAVLFVTSAIGLLIYGTIQYVETKTLARQKADFATIHAK